MVLRQTIRNAFLGKGISNEQANSKYVSDLGASGGWMSARTAGSEYFTITVSSEGAAQLSGISG